MVVLVVVAVEVVAVEVVAVEVVAVAAAAAVIAAVARLVHMLVELVPVPVSVQVPVLYQAESYHDI